jgi:quinol monooxygenase YgiN
VTVLLTMKTKPGRASELLAIFREILPDTRAREGCLGVDVVRDLDDPDSILLIQEWAERSNHESYRAWRAEQGTSALFAHLIAEPATLRYCEQRRDVHWG